MKELPYFKFYVNEWINGDITLENEKTQGLFVNILAHYWFKNCEIDIDFINKRLIKGKAQLKHSLKILIEQNIIKVDDNQNVTINFLDEQFDELLGTHNKKVEAGRKGGLSTAKAKPKHIDKDKDKIKNNIKIKIKDEKPEQSSSLHSILKSCFLDKYKDLTGESYYWTAKDGSATSQLIQKIKFTFKSKDTEADDEKIYDAFSILLDNLPEWYKNNFSMAIINSKYNEIINEIKNSKKNVSKISDEYKKKIVETLLNS